MKGLFVKDILPSFCCQEPCEDGSHYNRSSSVDQPLRLGQDFEPVDIYAFIAERSVERLDEGVVGWFSRSREVDSCSMMISPQVDQLTRELSAIIGKQIFGRTTSANKLINDLDNVFASQAVTRKFFLCTRLVSVAGMINIIFKV